MMTDQEWEAYERALCDRLRTGRPYVMPASSQPKVSVPLWFKVWVGICGALGLFAAGLLGWLLVTAISWLERH